MRSGEHKIRRLAASTPPAEQWPKLGLASALRAVFSICFRFINSRFSTSFNARFSHGGVDRDCPTPKYSLTTDEHRWTQIFEQKERRERRPLRELHELSECGLRRVRSAECGMGCSMLVAGCSGQRSAFCPEQVAVGVRSSVLLRTSGTRISDFPLPWPPTSELCLRPTAKAKAGAAPEQDRKTIGKQGYLIVWATLA